MNMKRNIIVGNSPLVNGNLGCVALSYSILYLIDEAMREKGVDYTIYWRVSLDKDFEEHSLKIGSREIRYTNFGYTLGKEHNTNPWWLFKALFWQTRINLAVWKKADFVLDIGEGDSFADLYGVKRLRKENRIHKLAQLFRKPYGLLPQTIGPFDSKEGQAIGYAALRKAQFVMARDRQSLDAIRENLPDYEHVQEYIDMAFVLPYKPVEMGHELTNVGLNISALLWNGGYNGKNQFGLKADYQEVIREIIAWLLAETDARIHLVPHVVPINAKVEDDYLVAERLAKELNSDRIVVAPRFQTPIEAKSYIAGLDFFMGSRMHATIAAYSSGVPVVPLAYSRKFNGLYRDTLNYPYMADLKADDTEKVLEVIADAYARRETIKDEIARQTIVKERVEKIKTDLQKYII